jgi:hypothetical protein
MIHFIDRNRIATMLKSDEFRTIEPLQAIGSSHPNKAPVILVQAVDLVRRQTHCVFRTYTVKYRRYL